MTAEAEFEEEEKVLEAELPAKEVSEKIEESLEKPTEG